MLVARLSYMYCGEALVFFTFTCFGSAVAGNRHIRTVSHQSAPSCLNVRAQMRLVECRRGHRLRVVMRRQESSILSVVQDETLLPVFTLPLHSLVKPDQERLAALLPRPQAFGIPDTSPNLLSHQPSCGSRGTRPRPTDVDVLYDAKLQLDMHHHLH